MRPKLVAVPTVRTPMAMPLPSSSFGLTHSLVVDSGFPAAQGTSPDGLRLRRRSGLPNGVSRGRPVC